MSRLCWFLLLSLCLTVSCRREHREAPGNHTSVAQVPLSVQEPRSTQGPAALLRPLIDPAKLATLGSRGTNPRIQKAVAILWTAKRDGLDPAKVAANAIAMIGWAGTAKGSMTVDALLRNLSIAEKLGAVPMR